MMKANCYTYVPLEAYLHHRKPAIYPLNKNM